MNKKIFFIPFLLLSLLWACDDDDNDWEVTGNPIQISGTISGMNAGEAATRFRGGAGLGMFIVNYAENEVSENIEFTKAQVRNEKYMQTAGGLVGDKSAYWGEAALVDVVAYYPWQKGAEQHPEAVVFEVAERQDTLKNNLSAYDESDFLWAHSRAGLSEGTVMLSFKHLMSKVVVYLKSDANTSGDMVGAKVLIQGTHTAARINLANGTVAPDVASGEIVAMEEEMEKAGFELAVKAVVVPQTVQKNTQLLEVQTLGGYSYFYNLPENLTFESGKQYTLEVTIESGECHVTIGNITDWTETSLILGNAEEDLPVFEVYDLYDRNGIRGMVISVDETGKHGYVISFDATELPFCKNEEVAFTGETSNEDGMGNMRKVMEVDPTLENYPAMKWCMDKNSDGKLRWYLPAENEVNILGDLVQEDEEEAFMSKLKAVGGEEATFEDLTAEMFGDYYYTLNEMSSTLKFSMFTDKMSFKRMEWRNWNTASQTTSWPLRAYYKF